MQVVEPEEAINFEMTYKGFRTIVKYSEEDKLYYGKIEDIFDLVNYESENYEGLERAFYEAVDDYLAFCEDLKVIKCKNTNPTEL